MQGTWVWALVPEDPTCHGANKPMSHNYWAHVPQLLKPAHLELVLHSKDKPPQWEAHLLQLEKAHVQQRRPKAAKNKLINYFKKQRKRWGDWIISLPPCAFAIGVLDFGKISNVILLDFMLVRFSPSFSTVTILMDPNWWLSVLNDLPNFVDILSFQS